MILLAEFIGAAIDSSIDKQLSIKGVVLLAIISAICWIPLDKFVGHCYSRQK
jgi:hypothetical protein